MTLSERHTTTVLFASCRVPILILLGTNVASIFVGNLTGRAKFADIHDIRVCDVRGRCFPNSVYRGLRYLKKKLVKSHEKVIVNMSFCCVYQPSLERLLAEVRSYFSFRR